MSNEPTVVTGLNHPSDRAEGFPFASTVQKSSSGQLYRLSAGRDLVDISARSWSSLERRRRLWRLLNQVLDMPIHHFWWLRLATRPILSCAILLFTMTQWEYKIVDLSGGWLSANERPTEDSLNELGEQGWELATAMATTGNHQAGVDNTLVFKRPQELAVSER